MWDFAGVDMLFLAATVPFPQVHWLCTQRISRSDEMAARSASPLVVSFVKFQIRECRATGSSSPPHYQQSPLDEHRNCQHRRPTVFQWPSAFGSPGSLAAIPCRFGDCGSVETRKLRNSGSCGGGPTEGPPPSSNPPSRSIYDCSIAAPPRPILRPPHHRGPIVARDVLLLRQSLYLVARFGRPPGCFLERLVRQCAIHGIGPAVFCPLSSTACLAASTAFRAPQAEDIPRQNVIYRGGVLQTPRGFEQNCHRACFHCREL